ncbi:MAG: hypothetical protein J6Y06_00480 [Bacteroidales bacterium]|nr:hypothetical protein [Bacteroidales bacterium]
MGTGEFFKRRLVRLHPMVIIGALIGLVVFICQGRMSWDGVQSGWLRKGVYPFGPYAWCTPVAIVIIVTVSAVLLSKYYDKPLRKRLSDKYLMK